MKQRRKSKSSRGKVRNATPVRKSRGPSFVIDVPETTFQPVVTEPPRFVIGIKSPEPKATPEKVSEPTDSAEKLDTFLSLALYGEDEGASYIDASDPDNIEKARQWWDENLHFLSWQDASDLERIWKNATKDGSYIKLFSSSVRYLQEKY